jgi:hypothetical protein
MAPAGEEHAHYMPADENDDRVAAKGMDYFHRARSPKEIGREQLTLRGPIYVQAFQAKLPGDEGSGTGNRLAPHERRRATLEVPVRPAHRGCTPAVVKPDQCVNEGALDPSSFTNQRETARLA